MAAGQPPSARAMAGIVLSVSGIASSLASAVLFALSGPVLAQTSSPSALPESSGETPPGFTTAPLADFDAFVEAQLKKWNAPGAAIVVVKDGKVVLQRGYGYRDLEKKLPMTVHTVQPIASITKSFTVTSLATLVRDGKLAWDKPVRDYLPDFKLYNDYATLNVTPRDLVTHRTGLPRHDFAWVGTKATRDELYKRIQFMEPSAAPRTQFQYNNFMYMTAGYLGGKVAGSTWEELVQKNVFDPLEMRTANFSVDTLLKAPDHATPYQHDYKDTPHATTHLSAQAMGPTGSINASAEDMGKYLRMLMNKGQYNGKTIINAADLRDMTNPQMVMPFTGRYEEVGPTQYGMGFFVSTYRGLRVVNHGGNLAGLSALLTFLPQQNIGVYVATNLSGTPVPLILTNAATDRLLGMKPIDWSGRFWDVNEKNKASEEDAKKQNLTPRKLGTRPSHSLDDYIGEYTHPAYDVLKITRRGDELIGTYNGYSSLFKHFHYDVFEAPDDKLNFLSKLKLAFQSDIEGEISSLKIAIEPAVKPLEFVRQPDGAFKEPAFLKQFEGDYEMGANTVTIRLRSDNVLTSSSAGQPVRELTGLRGSRFAVKDLSGFTIEFVPDRTGKITQAAFYQPNGNFVAKKK